MAYQRKGIKRPRVYTYEELLRMDEEEVLIAYRKGRDRYRKATKVAVVAPKNITPPPTPTAIKKKGGDIRKELLRLQETETKIYTPARKEQFVHDTRHMVKQVVGMSFAGISREGKNKKAFEAEWIDSLSFEELQKVKNILDRYADKKGTTIVDSSFVYQMDELDERFNARARLYRGARSYIHSKADFMNYIENMGEL